MPPSTLVIIAGSIIGGILLFWFFLSLLFRRVVDTNQVHIVQSSKKTISYGTNQEAGNVYHEWPTWIPRYGVKRIVLPVSNFDLSLKDYPAYDQDRVPFKVDITAFFRIEDTNVAAQRVQSIQELEKQLESVVQGAVRTILASHTIDDIMTQRDTFGESFTHAVEGELKNWGVIPVKNLELMDIRDAEESKVIYNIMAKKKSFIEMESRQQVAENNKNAELAEIRAQQEADIRRQEAEQLVGQRTAEKDKEVGIANEMANQSIKEQQVVTTEKEMAVKEKEAVRQAEIARETSRINLEQAELDAQATLKEGEAEAAVKRKVFLADGALEIRLKMQKETSIGVAQALADGNVDLVPRMYIGGSDAENGGPADATSTLSKIMMMQMASAQMPELPKLDASAEEDGADNTTSTAGKAKDDNK